MGGGRRTMDDDRRVATETDRQQRTVIGGDGLWTAAGDGELRWQWLIVEGGLDNWWGASDGGGGGQRPTDGRRPSRPFPYGDMTVDLHGPPPHRGNKMFNKRNNSLMGPG